MKLLKMLDPDDKFITFEMEDDDDHIPVYGDSVYCDCTDSCVDEMILGNLVYDKFGIKTYEILERSEHLDDDDIDEQEDDI